MLAGNEGLLRNLFPVDRRAPTGQHHVADHEKAAGPSRAQAEQAATVLKGRRVADGVRMLVVPGSQQIKKAAEDLGLDRVFVEAGAEWRESGCSMCLGMNGDTVARGQLSVSTSNRNFEGRQGIGARTVLASPLTAAASAIRGRVADPRPFLDGS